MDQEPWFQTSEAEDVIASLKVLRDTIQKVQEDPHYWKWAILSLHSAVQGAIVCHLSGSMQIGALTEKSASAIIKSSEAEFDGPSVEERMAPPRELFRRISNKDKRLEAAGEVFETDDAETFYMLICDLRDNLTHFTPKYWVLGLSALPTTIIVLMKFIEQIAQIGWAFRHMGSHDVLALTAQIKHLADALSVGKPDPGTT